MKLHEYLKTLQCKWGQLKSKDLYFNNEFYYYVEDPVFVLHMLISHYKQNPTTLSTVPEKPSTTITIKKPRSVLKIFVFFERAKKEGTLVKIVKAENFEYGAGVSKSKYIIVPNIEPEEFVKLLTEGKIEINDIEEKSNCYIVRVKYS